MIEQVSPNAFRLDLGDAVSSRTISVFHVKYLRPARDGPYGSPGMLQPLPVFEEDGQDHWEVAGILDRKRHYGKNKYLVQYKGYPLLDDCEWRPEQELKDFAPQILAVESATSAESTIQQMTVADSATTVSAESTESVNPVPTAVETTNTVGSTMPYPVELINTVPIPGEDLDSMHDMDDCKTAAWSLTALSYNKRHLPLTHKSLPVGAKAFLLAKYLTCPEQRAQKSSEKLRDRRWGPYAVQRWVTPTTVELNLPKSISNAHNVFHVSRLLENEGQTRGGCAG